MRKFVVLTIVVLTALCFALPATAQTTELRDHLQCLKIKKDDLKKLKATAIVDLMGGEPANGCKVKAVGKLYCIPAAKTLVDADGLPTVPFSGGAVPNDFICYKLKCSKSNDSSIVTDQFGRRGMDFKQEKMLCLPAQTEF